MTTMTTTPAGVALERIGAELAEAFEMFEPWVTERSLLTDGPTWTYRADAVESRNLTVGYEPGADRWRVWTNTGSSWSGVSSDRLADAVAHHVPWLAGDPFVSGAEWRRRLADVLADLEAVTA